jgi:hypothetical protein
VICPDLESSGAKKSIFIGWGVMCSTLHRLGWSRLFPPSEGFGLGLQEFKVTLVSTFALFPNISVVIYVVHTLSSYQFSFLCSVCILKCWYLAADIHFHYALTQIVSVNQFATKKIKPVELRLPHSFH